MGYESAALEDGRVMCVKPISSNIRIIEAIRGSWHCFDMHVIHGGRKELLSMNSNGILPK